MPAAQTPSISSLIYVNADQFMQAVDESFPAFTRRWTTVPCRSRLVRSGELSLYVESGELASHLLAAAFWSLREQNLVDLALTQTGWEIFSIYKVSVHQKENLPHDAAPQYVGPVACSPSAIAAAQFRQQKIMPSCSTRVEASMIVVAQWAQVPAAPSR
jgi:hypothetical protein